MIRFKLVILLLLPVAFVSKGQTSSGLRFGMGATYSGSSFHFTGANQTSIISTGVPLVEPKGFIQYFYQMGENPWHLKVGLASQGINQQIRITIPLSDGWRVSTSSFGADGVQIRASFGYSFLKEKDWILNISSGLGLLTFGPTPERNSPFQEVDSSAASWLAREYVTPAIEKRTFAPQLLGEFDFGYALGKRSAIIFTASGGLGLLPIMFTEVQVVIKSDTGNINRYTGEILNRGSFYNFSIGYQLTLFLPKSDGSD